MAVTAYSDRDFKGKSEALRPGRYKLGGGGVGDRAISSVRVTDGWEVTLFDGPGQTGTSRTFCESAAYVGDDLNARASSVEVSDFSLGPLHVRDTAS